VEPFLCQKKTTDSKDPFIKWAAAFLKKHGAPLIPIASGANRFLFEEVDRYELTYRCVLILKDLEKKKKSPKLKGSANDAQTIFCKLFSFMGIGRLKAFFSPEINVAFVHDSSIFVPESSLTRDLVVKVLNVSHSQVEGSQGENYSCLLQSIFEKITVGSRRFESSDATVVINRAKEICKESRDFLVSANINVPHENVTKKSTRKLITLDSDDEICEMEKNSSSSSTKDQSAPTTMNDIENQIKRVSQRAKSRKRNNHGNVANNTIIPEAMFENDNAGNDCCLRPSSSLTSVNVSAAFGGGFIWFDNISAAQVENDKFEAEHQNKIVKLREILDKAKKNC
jgi:hypothetical protein